MTINRLITYNNHLITHLAVKALPFGVEWVGVILKTLYITERAIFENKKYLYLYPLMAIAIKRTPVLRDKAAAHFSTMLEKVKTKETKASISHSIADTKAILAHYKALQ